MAVAGKTRTTTAHGPTAAKKVYKAPAATSGAKKPYSTKPYPSKGGPAAPRAAPGTAEAKSQAEVRRKRKAEEEAHEPEKPKVVNSLLNAPEEIDFPRGGGTNLTQVEVREAQLEGEKEAMDEEAVSSPSYVWLWGPWGKGEC